MMRSRDPLEKKTITQTGVAQSGAGICKNIGFFIVPEFAPLGVLGAVEALRTANRISGEALYSWNIISLDGEPVKSANGLTLEADTSIFHDARYDLVFICIGFFPERFCDQKTLSWVRKLDRHGVSFGSISTGTYMLAKAGVIKNRKCVIHGDNIASLLEEYPDLQIDLDIYRIDNGLYTCAGGTAAIDLFVQIIAEDNGESLAVATAHQLQHDRIRSAEDAQSKYKRTGLRLRSPALAAAIDLMEKNVETPLAPAEIARELGVSQRQLQRIFKKHLGQPPIQFYRRLRIDHSQNLLLNSSLSITEIGIASGFGTPTNFSKSYRARFGYTPHFERQNAR